MKSAFVHFEQRLQLINDVVKPGYAALGLACSDDLVGRLTVSCGPRPYRTGRERWVLLAQDVCRP